MKYELIKVLLTNWSIKHSLKLIKKKLEDGNAKINIYDLKCIKHVIDLFFQLKDLKIWEILQIKYFKVF